MTIRETTADRWRRLRRELRRIFPALVIAIGVVELRRRGVLAPEDPLTVMLYKPALATIGFIAAHMIRQPAFPYLDLEMCLESPNIGKALGGAVVIGLIYLAFILGVTLGL